MKLRQKILGGIVIAGMLALVLGLSGVFAPRRSAMEPVEWAEDGKASARQMEIVTKGFRAMVKDWVLTAPEARRAGVDGKTVLTKPRLVMKGVRDGVEMMVTARSERGVYTKVPEEHVVMSGGVVVRYEGTQTVELRTERLEVAPVEERGWTDAEVLMTLETKEGTHTLTGTGARIDYVRRTGQVLKNVKLVLSSGEALFPTGGDVALRPDAPVDEQKPVKTTITAAGPAVAEELKRTVTLNNEVVIRQGDSELSARMVSVRFSERVGGEAEEEDADEEGAAFARVGAVERFVADGDVRFHAGDGRGSCDRLTRDSSDGQVLLRGKPAMLEQAGNKVMAGRIELDPEAGSVFVPVAGKLNFAAQGTKQKDIGPMSVAWERSMRLDRELHEAVFRGGVRFRAEGQAIDSDSLSVRFDETNRNIIEARADGHVRVKGRMEAFGPKKKVSEPKAADEVTARSEHMTYKPEKEVLIFSGDTEITRGRQVVRGERVTLSQKDESVRVDGAGSMEGTQEKDGKQERMKVVWGEDMQFSRASGKAEFTGGVSLEQGGRTMSAKRLTAVLGKDNELKSLDAIGDAVVVEKSTDAVGVGQERRMRAERLTARMGKGNRLEKFEARGRAVIEEKTTTKEGAQERRMEADHLVIRVSEKNKLEGLLATGNAVVVDQGRTARGDYIEVTDEGNTIVMKGPGSLEGEDTSGAEPVKVKMVWVERMRYERDTGKAMFRKGVTLHHGERVMRADKVDAVLTEKDLRSLDARGNVVLKEAEQIVRGDRLVWDMKKDLGRLSGEPAMFGRGTERLFGEVIEFAQKGGSVRIRSRRRVEGVINGQLTVDNGQLPAFMNY